MRDSGSITSPNMMSDARSRIEHSQRHLHDVHAGVGSSRPPWSSTRRRALGLIIIGTYPMEFMDSFRKYGRGTRGWGDGFEGTIFN
jgi:hypothetical protein